MFACVDVLRRELVNISLQGLKLNVICILSLQGDALCKQCFFSAFEAEIHQTITDAELFRQGERVAVGASGGKGTFLNWNPLTA